MKVTEKNELSYIFSLFCVSPEASYYAIDAESGKVVGATVSEADSDNHFAAYSLPYNHCNHFCPMPPQAI